MGQSDSSFPHQQRSQVPPGFSTFPPVSRPAELRRIRAQEAMIRCLNSWAPKRSQDQRNRDTRTTPKKRPPFNSSPEVIFSKKGLVWGLLGFKPLPVLFVPTNSILSGVTRGVEDSKKTSCLFALKVPGRPLIQQGLFWKRPPLILVRIHTMELGTILLVIGLTYRFSLKCWW